MSTGSESGNSTASNRSVWRRAAFVSSKSISTATTTAGAWTLEEVSAPIAGSQGAAGSTHRTAMPSATVGVTATTSSARDAGPGPGVAGSGVAVAGWVPTGVGVAAVAG